MSDLHYELSQYITDEKDQDTVLELFWELQDGGNNAQIRKENAKKIIDLRSIYGEDLDHAISMLLDRKGL
jgi:hypothetical protein